MSVFSGNYTVPPVYATVASLPVLPVAQDGSQAYCTALNQLVYSRGGLWFRLDGTLVTNPAKGIILGTQGIVHTGTTQTSLLSTTWAGAVPTTGFAQLNLTSGALVTNTAGTTNTVNFIVTVGGNTRTVTLLMTAAAASPAVYVVTVNIEIILSTLTGNPVVDMRGIFYLSNPAAVTVSNIANRGAGFPQYAVFKAATIPASNPAISLAISHNTAAATTSSATSPTILKRIS